MLEGCAERGCRYNLRRSALAAPSFSRSFLFVFSSLRALPSSVAVSAALAVTAPAAPAAAQETNVWTTATVAGGNVNDGGPAASGRLYSPNGVAVDGAGNLYIADAGNNRIRKVDASTGIISTVAGTGTRGYSASDDGAAATSAQINWPAGVAVDGSGNLYITDTNNHRIRKVDASTGIISTVAGTGASGYSGDGAAATSAQIDLPRGVALDGSGNLYIADAWNNRIRKVDTAGVITTIAGTTLGFSGDGGTATAAQLSHPHDMAVDGAGNLYIADTQNHRIRKVDTAGVITTVAGGGSSLGDGGAATAAQLSSPHDVAVDGSGNLYIADTTNNRIRKVDASTGIISTVAGTGVFGFSGDGGPATSAQISSPEGVAVDGSGNLYIADWDNHRIRKVDAATGNISTVAGTTADVGDGGLAASAHLRSPIGVAVDGSGNLYIADWDNHRVRKVDTAGVITTVAGTGTQGFSGDGGQATMAELFNPRGVAVDGSGNLYIADTVDQRIRKVDTAGVITTVAGTGAQSYGGDGGQATAAQISSPEGVAVDGSGNLYIADWGNHRVRKVNTAGVITTVTGTGTGGISGDGGVATAAQINGPSDVAVDGSGNIYIADYGNHRIRKVDASTGNISTVAGTGTAGYSGDGGAATAAQFDGPFKVAVDGAGNLYIADGFNNRVRKVDAESGTISTIAVRTVTPTALFTPSGVAVDGAGNVYIADGNNHRVLRAAALPPLPSNPEAPGRVIEDVGGDGTPGGDGDGGPAASARVNSPSGVAIDGAGNVYIADTRNNRVRRIDPDGIIDEFAGDGTAGFGGDGGAAVDAQLKGPNGAAVDRSGNVYIADTGNHRIRKVDASTGNISTVAGTGTAGYRASDDGGAAAAAQLNNP